MGDRPNAEAAPHDGWPQLSFSKATIQVPKRVDVATVELDENDVALALCQFVRARYNLRPFDQVELSHGSVAWKNSEFNITVTRDDK